MTTINLAPTIDALTGSAPAEAASFRAVAMRAGRTAVRVTAGTVRFPTQLTARWDGTAWDAAPALHVLPPDCYWNVRIAVAGNRLERNAILPSTATTVDFGDLIDVTPETAQPDSSTVAQWAALQQYIANQASRIDGVAATISSTVGTVQAQIDAAAAAQTAIAADLTTVTTSAQQAAAAAAATAADRIAVAGDLSAVQTALAAGGTGTSDPVGAAAAAQAFAVQRANHTGTQPASTVTGLAAVAISGSYTDLTDKPAGGGTGGGITTDDALAAVYDAYTSGDQSDIFWDQRDDRGGSFLQLASQTSPPTTYPPSRSGQWAPFARYALPYGPNHGSTRFSILGTPLDVTAGPILDYSEVILSAAWDGSDTPPSVDIAVVKATRLVPTDLQATTTTGITASIDDGYSTTSSGYTVTFWIRVPDDLHHVDFRRLDFVNARAAYLQPAADWSTSPGGTTGHAL